MTKIMAPLATLMLISCGGGLTDATVIAQPAPPMAQPGRLEGAPEPTLPAPPAYRSANRRSPFQPAGVAAEGGLAVQPDFERTKAPLERFALRELHMVGTLAGRGVMRALIRDPQGRIHALRTGDYLGLDYGRIDVVRAAGVDLIEMVRDGSGGWMQRARVLAVQSEHARPGAPAPPSPASDGGGHDS